MRKTVTKYPAVVLLCCVGATFAAATAHACEYDYCHSTGAVSKPGGWDIRLPFEAGETVQALSGYGPNAGSSLHCRSQDSICANDYYALDFVLPNHSEYGRYQPVLAIAAGTVWDAAWGSEGWSNYGQRVYILHDYDADGHQYASMYAHLETITVSDGQHVSQGQQIGTLGRSCEGSLECGSFSTPHVHFSIHRDSGFGGTGSGGSYGGRATIPESIDGYSNIQQWDTMISSNGTAGDDDDDASDDDDDDYQPDDCLIQGETIIEEDGPCASVVGTLNDADGHGGHAYWATKEEVDPDYDQGVNWMFEFPAAGDHDLWIWVPEGLGALTTDADYKVFYGDQSAHVYVPQAGNEGTWVHLGTFSFEPGGDQWVRLGDNYTSAEDQGLTVAFDALKIAPVTECECTTAGAIQTQHCGIDGEQWRECDGCSWGPWSECDEGADDDDGAAADDDDGGPGEGGWESGCGCGHESRAVPIGGAVVVGFAAWTALRRRRGT